MAVKNRPKNTKRNTRSSRPEVFCKKSVLRNFTKFTGKQASGCRPQACDFIKKETLAQLFACEFCETSKNTFLHRTPLVAASLISKFVSLKLEVLGWWFFSTKTFLRKFSWRSKLASVQFRFTASEKKLDYYYHEQYRSSHRKCSVKKSFL